MSQATKKKPAPPKASEPAKADPDARVPREDLRDLVVKSEWVLVGELQLRLREPGMLTAAEAAAALFDEGFTEAARQAGLLVALEVENQKNYGAAALRFVLGANGAVVAQLLFEAVRTCGRGPYAVAILLDSAENRKRFFELTGIESDEQENEDDPGSVWSPAFRSWVARNLTPTQFEYALGKLEGMRGWADLAKKILGRLGLKPGLIAEIRAAAGKPSLPAGAPPTST